LPPSERSRADRIWITILFNAKLSHLSESLQERDEFDANPKKDPEIPTSWNIARLMAELDRNERLKRKIGRLLNEGKEKKFKKGGM
jgi:hypothetical protein